MHKILNLASVLRRSSGSEESTQKAMHTFTIIIAVAIAVAMVFLGINMESMQQLLGDPINIIQSLFMVGTLIALFLTIAPIINTMYMSNDITVLLTFPYTANEIICAKILNVSSLVMLMTAIFTIPCGVSYGIVNGLGGGFYLAILFAFICTPIIALSFIASIIILLMYFVQSLRNKDALKIIGACVAFAVMIALIIVIEMNKMDSSVISGIASTLTGFNNVLPINFALKALMVDGISLIPILEVIGITAGFFIIFALLVHFLYIPGALSMQDTASSGITLNDKLLDKLCKPQSVLKAYFLKEFRHVRREPAYLMNGFLMPLIYPIVFIIIYVFAANGIEMLSLSNITSDGAAVVWVTCISVLITIVASSTNAISASCISREGEDLMLLKQTQIDYKIVIKAKQYVSVLVCAAGSTSYIVIGIIILSILGIVPIWTLPYALVINIGTIFFCVDISMLHDFKNASFVWESEADMLKSRYGAVTYGLLIAGIMVPIFAATILMNFPSFAWILMAVMVVLSVVITILKNKKLYKVGLELMAKF